MAIQTTTNTYPGRGLLGELARPGEPYAIDFLPAQVPSSGRKPRPGDSVYWDETNNGAAFPTTAALRRTVIGIVHYDLSAVQKKLSAVPSGADTDQFIEYEDGEFMPVVVMGTVFIRAGAAVEYGQLLSQSADYKYDPDDPTDYGSIPQRGIECVSLAGADNGLIEARVTSGRAK